MTTGHKHRTIVMRNGALLRLLRAPLIKSLDLDRAQRSRYAWRAEPHDGGNVYVLSLLGILHGWFGLTVETR